MCANYVAFREGFVVDPFWGSTTPVAISNFPRALQACEPPDLQKSLDVALLYLTGEKLEDKDFEGRSEAVVVGCQAIISAALKVNSNYDIFLRDLTNLNVPKETATEIWKVKTSNCSAYLNCMVPLAYEFESTDHRGELVSPDKGLKRIHSASAHNFQR